MQLNSLVLRQSSDTIIASGYVLELEHRLDDLQALYEEHTDPAPTDRFAFSQLVGDYIGRGGQIHYVIDADGQVIGSAYLMGSHSLLQNVYPVERFFVAKTLDHQMRYNVARALLDSLIETATVERASRPDSIWIQVFIPAGALTHPESQPIHGALEATAFRGAGVDQADLWVRLISK